MEEQVIFWLPWPPTVNAYYKAVRSAIYLSKRGRMYKETCEPLIRQQIPDLELDVPLLCEVTLFPPDRRTRDLDNYMKALLDAVTLSKLWTDDALIDQLFIYRGEAGYSTVKVEVGDAGPVIPYDGPMKR